MSYDHTTYDLCNLIVYKVPMLRVPYHYANLVRLWSKKKQIMQYVQWVAGGAGVDGGSLRHHAVDGDVRGGDRRRLLTPVQDM